MKAWARNKIRERVPEGTMPKMTLTLWVLALIGFPSTARRSLIDHLRALTALPGDRFCHFSRDIEGIVVSGRPRHATIMCATRQLLCEWSTALEDVAPPNADPDFPRIRAMFGPREWPWLEQNVDLTRWQPAASTSDAGPSATPNQRESL